MVISHTARESDANFGTWKGTCCNKYLTVGVALGVAVGGGWKNVKAYDRKGQRCSE